MIVVAYNVELREFLPVAFILLSAKTEEIYIHSIPSLFCLKNNFKDQISFTPLHGEEKKNDCK
jgi:hypothetical protein